MAVLAESLSLARPDRRVVRQPQAIGSVLPLPPTNGGPRPDSLWASWTAGYRHVAAYGSARSALAALLEFRGIERIWLPAYGCPALAQGASVCQPLWYGVDASLNPDFQRLAQSARRGDAVLAIDYFGRSPVADFTAFATARPDILWIEDRAQALAPDGPAWGDILLYSPRKLIGVGEGGLLVADSKLPVPAGPPTHRSIRAQMARAADPDGVSPASWFASFRSQEAAFGIDDSPMGEQTHDILGRVAAPPLAAQRRANAAILGNHLPDLALWPDIPPAFAPLAFPIRVQDCAALAASLATVGIYCARHWPDLPSDPAHFPLAHRLSRDLLSLPCDHRYDANDMLRIVDALRSRNARPASSL